MQLRTGKTLLIANPAAQNGKGAAAAEFAAALLRTRLGADMLDVALTQAPHHAVDIAAQAGEYAEVIALGGDGVIHETVNGLMRIPCEKRPVFGILPVGSGNDYARTLGMSSRVEEAVSQLLEAMERPLDVGICNGEYFVETLSFGLDAAIAVDTMERRKRTGRTGTIMYLEAGIDQLLHHLDTYAYSAIFRGAQLCPTGGARSAASFEALRKASFPEECGGADRDLTVRSEMIMFGVQIGQTYGGGFRVCPDAQPDDGLFDVCIAHPPLPMPVATVAFLMAKNGNHTNFRQLEFLRAEGMRIEFDEPPAVQMDGEKVEGSVFEVGIVPRALRVLMPSS